MTFLRTESGKLVAAGKGYARYGKPLMCSRCKRRPPARGATLCDRCKSVAYERRR